MSKKLSVILIVLLAVIILGLAFYWYEYRPARIAKKCNSYAEDIDPTIYYPGIEKGEINYIKCLRDNGLDK